MLDIYAAQKAAQALAGKAGLTVRFHDEGLQSYCTDAAGVLYIPRPSLDWSREDVTLWRNGYSHEVGHHIPGNRDVFPMVLERKIDMATLFGIALNCVDDVRNDRVRTDMYPGMKPDHIAATAQIVRAHWSKPMPTGDGVPNAIVRTLTAAMVACHALTDDALAASYDQMRGCLDAQCNDWLDTLERDGWLARWYGLETGEQEYEFVRDTLRDVFGLSPEETGESEHSDGSESNGEDGDGDGKESGKGKASGKGKPGDSDSDSDGKDSDKESDKESKGKALAPTVKYDDLLSMPQHDKAFSEKRTGLARIDYSTSTNTDGYDPHTALTTKVHTPTGTPHAGYVRALEATIAESNVRDIAGHARRYLQAETRKRDLHNQRTGKLDTRKLSKAATYRGHDVPAVFKQPAPKKAINTAVSILVDGSGSMRACYKFELAVAAAYGMASVCLSFQVPCEIAVFSETSEDCNEHFIVKAWHERLEERTVLDRCALVQERMANNADGDSILVAYSRLIQRTEAKRLLVVMSDGSPAGYRMGNLDRYTKAVIDRIERERLIDIMGVGIMDDNVSRLYKRYSVVWNPAEIPAKLVEVLKSNITL